MTQPPAPDDSPDTGGPDALVDNRKLLAIMDLMGVVTREEGQRAAIVASQVSGVSKVVTLFEYVSDAELSRILGTDRPDGKRANITSGSSEVTR